MDLVDSCCHEVCGMKLSIQYEKFLNENYVMSNTTDEYLARDYFRFRKMESSLTLHPSYYMHISADPRGVSVTVCHLQRRMSE